jgi:hypothetical protein
MNNSNLDLKFIFLSHEIKEMLIKFKNISNQVKLILVATIIFIFVFGINYEPTLYLLSATIIFLIEYIRIYDKYKITMFDYFIDYFFIKNQLDKNESPQDI